MQNVFEIAARIHYLVSIPSTSKCISACTAVRGEVYAAATGRCVRGIAEVRSRPAGPRQKALSSESGPPHEESSMLISRDSC